MSTVSGDTDITYVEEGDPLYFPGPVPFVGPVYGGRATDEILEFTGPGITVTATKTSPYRARGVWDFVDEEGSMIHVEVDLVCVSCQGAPVG